MARPDLTTRFLGLDPKSPAGRLLGAAERAIIENPTVFTAGILLLLWLILSQLSPYFFTVSNLFEITVQAAVIALIAVGQTFVILSKGIDLSVGAILAASAVTSTMVMDAGYGLGAGVIAGIVVGAFFGAANGVAVGYLRIPPFVATLGMMGIARGYALIITEGGPADATLFLLLYLYWNGFRFFKMGYASAIAWILFFVILFLTIVQFLTARRWVYYEGERAS